MPSEDGGWRRSAARAVAVLCGTLMLCWPAFWNGYPLLFPDSLQYVANGDGVWLKLSGQPVPAWMYTSMRSEVYEAGIALLHRGVSLWPVAAAQALLTAWVVWLVVRSLCRRPVRVYLVLMVLLSALTSIAWYASFITPDILGPVLYLCIYLLVFAAEALRRWEMGVLAVIAWWTAGAHATHLMLAAGLCCLLGVLWLAGRLGMRRRGGRLLGVAGIVLLTAGTQMAVHQRLYGRPSLFGEPPPFLMARLLGDGPARTYLQQHCATINWMICHDADRLPATDGDFLWKPDGIWQTATPEQRQHLLSEQMPLARVTLRAYPLQQAARSWSNFLQTLTTVGPQEFSAYPGALTAANLEFSMTGLSARFARTRQARDAMPQAFFRDLQLPLIAGSALVVAVLLPWFWRFRSAGGALERLLGLAAVVLFIVPVNALLSGTLSGVYSRYEGRVVWLVMLLTGLMVAMYRDRASLETGSVTGAADSPTGTASAPGAGPELIG